MARFNSRLAPAVAAGGLLIFLVIAALVVTGQAAELDRAGLLALQAAAEEVHPRGPAWMREAARDLTALGSISVLALVSLIGAFWLVAAGSATHAAIMVLWIAGGTLASFLLKALFSQPRPDLVALAPQVFTSSFPSAHAMTSAATFLLLALAVGVGLRQRSEARALLIAAIVLTLISGLSRVYLGVHWPSDVLAGWAIGAAWVAMACWLAPVTFLRR